MKSGDGKCSNALSWRTLSGTAPLPQRMFRCNENTPVNIRALLTEIEIDDAGFYRGIHNRMMPDLGNNIVSYIEQANPGLKVARHAVLLLQVRSAAGMEVGNKDQISF